jgi:arylsulfatase A-like enzyme
MARGSAARDGFVSLTVRTALGLAAAFLLVDLWQIAVVRPASLTWPHVGALAGLYLAGAGVATAAVLGMAALARVSLRERGPVLRAALACAGLFLVAQELVLRELPSRSPWKLRVTAAAALLALACLPPLAALLRRGRSGRRTAAVVVLLLAVGAWGAVHGFTGRGGGATAPRTAVRPTGPNIVLVTIDTLRADHLSCYGYDRPTSPNIDAFAREATLFTRAYSQSSWTKPATASLLTSHYPTMHGANLEVSRLADAETLVFEPMRAAGYITAVFSGNPWITPEYGFDQGVDRFYSVYDERFARVTLLMQALKRVNRLVESQARVYNGVKTLVQGELSTTARDARLNAEALLWLAAQGDRPFFAYLHYMSPHHPYDPPPPWDTKFNPHPHDPPVTYYPRKSFYFYEEGEPLSPDRLADMIGRYDGDIGFVDDVFGRLVAELRRTGLLERTVVIVTADHGEEFFEHRNWGHGHSVYNELLHVPLIVRWPAAFRPGARVDEPVMSADVVPTILALAGVAPTAPLAGQSLVPLGGGAALAGDDGDRVYSELLYRYGAGYSLQGRERKLVETVIGGETRQTLFDLTVDPREQRNVLDGKPGDGALVSHLDGLRRWAGEHHVAAGETTITPDMDQRLKALGYVN